MIFSIKEKKYPQVNSRRVINRFAWTPIEVNYRQDIVDPTYRIWLETYQVLQEYSHSWGWTDVRKFMDEKRYPK